MYGNPIRLTSYCHLRKEISILLEKNIYPHHSKAQLEYKLSNYKTACTILLPFSWLKNRDYGVGLSEKNVVSLNEYIQLHFEVCFFTFLMDRLSRNHRFNTVNESIEEFANHYNIIIDEDITMEALVKMSFRLRKKFCNPIPAITTPKKVVRYQPCHQPSLF